VYVKFPVKTLPPDLARAVGDRPVALVIWTTTPWTLPANLAIAVHPSETYTAVELDGQALIVAKPLLEAFLRLPGVAGRGAARPMSVSGQQLASLVARHPWIDRDVPVLTADFVAMDAGTGLVHIAPGHGEEDYELGRRAGLKIYNPVDDDGRFGRPTRGSSSTCARRGRWWRACRSSTRIPIAGAARIPPCSAPPSSGSSRSTATGSARRRSMRSGPR
jgi:isoleucyl-tRNA synthetase